MVLEVDVGFIRYKFLSCLSEGGESPGYAVHHPLKTATTGRQSVLNVFLVDRGGGADLTKIQPAGIRTKSGGARSIEAGKGPVGSGLSLGVAGVENGGRKDATFLRPRW